jgi:hypothetical protein
MIETLASQKISLKYACDADVSNLYHHTLTFFFVSGFASAFGCNETFRFAHNLQALLLFHIIQTIMVHVFQEATSCRFAYLFTFKKTQA